METTTQAVEPVDVILDTISKSLNARLEEDRDVVNKALGKIAEGCDKLVEDTKAKSDFVDSEIARLEGLVKSMGDTLNAALEALAAKTVELEKSVNLISSEPIRKSIQATDVIAAPAEAITVAPSVTANELITKCLVDIKVAPEGRRLELSRAVALLECGVSPIEVKRDFNL
jgi:uncharacterized protein YoxC